MPRLLAANVGSSSLKMDLWTLPGSSPAAAAAAQGIGTRQGSIVLDGGKEEPQALPDHAAALGVLLDRLPDSQRLDGIGHRVVHGGSAYRDPVWLDDAVLAGLDAVTPIIPLHMPPALAVIRALLRARPRVPQAAVFDTAFHATLPPRALHYAVPEEWRGWGVRRYGFHGLACADAVYQLGSGLCERAVLIHLGSGCSATALLRGASVDTTMGLTPLEGLMMGTRAGDLDPGILVYVQREHGVPPDRLDQILNHECGLAGLSGVSSDMKSLLARLDEPRVALAIEVFCYRAARAVGALTVALGGCDQLVFTGGAGEHAAPVRERICRLLAHLGVRLDAAKNRAHAPVISAPRSAVRVDVVRVEEGRQIALAVGRLLGSQAVRGTPAAGPLTPPRARRPPGRRAGARAGRSRRTSSSARDGGSRR